MKLMMANLARCFGTWAEFYRRKRKETNLLKKFGKRMRNKVLFSLYSTWKVNARKQREGKILAFRVLCRIANAKLSAGFIQWMAFTKKVRFWESRSDELTKRILGLVANCAGTSICSDSVENSDAIFNADNTTSHATRYARCRFEKLTFFRTRPCVGS